MRFNVTNADNYELMLASCTTSLGDQFLEFILNDESLSSDMLNKDDTVIVHSQR